MTVSENNDQLRKKENIVFSGKLILKKEEKQILRRWYIESGIQACLDRKYYPRLLIITITSTKLNTLMFRLNMSQKTTLQLSSIITLITIVLDTFMFRQNMLLKITLLRKLTITLITGVLNTFMFRINMFLKTTSRCSLIIT